jgi:hypothetical protein
MSQLVKMKRQVNFKDFERFGLVEQKKTLYSTRGSLKRSFHSRFKLAHSCKKKSNLHLNSLNKLQLVAKKWELSE